MIVSDIRTRVQRSFGDESGVQVTDADIYRWINDGQRQIVLQNEGLLETTSTTNAVANQKEYAVPVDLLILRAVHFKYTGELSHYPLKGLKFSEFEEYISGWDGTAYNKSRPTAFTVYAGNIITFPTTDVSITGGIKIYYNRKPTDVAALSDTPDLPVLYHETLVKYCLTQAYEMDEDWTASEQKAAELQSDIRLLRGREDWKFQGTYPTITVCTEDLN